MNLLLFSTFHQRINFGSLIKNCNHKGLGIYYLLSAFIFGISGTLISVLIRIELYSAGNRIISPENQNFYNISITLHGFLMIFFLVMPAVFGGFGNYFVPIFQGSPEVVYPRVNNFSILILSLSYLFVILSLFSEFGGGTGWTLYPPLSTSLMSVGKSLWFPRINFQFQIKNKLDIFKKEFMVFGHSPLLITIIISSFISIHQEVASDSFSFLINSSWFIVFILEVFLLIFLGFNLYCWKTIHFSQNLDLIFLYLFLFFFISFHFWFRDLLRELNQKYEVLLIIFFLVFLLFLVSEGLLFLSFFWTSFHSLSSPSLGIWPEEGSYVPDPCDLTFANTLLLSNAAISLGNAFISLEISSSFLIFFSLFYPVNLR